MKIKFALAASFLFFVFTVNAQTWQWTHPEPNGSGNPEADDAHDVETDAAGNVYVLGDYNDSLFLNNVYRTTGSGSYLAKYDSTGKLLWYKTVVPIGPAYSYNYHRINATDLVVNSTGVYITGHYDATFCGECEAGSLCKDLTVNDKVSYQIGSLQFASDYNEIGFFVTKFTAAGNVVWNNLGTYDDCINGSYVFEGGILYNPLITSDKSNNIICEFMYGGGSTLQLGGASIPTPPPTNNLAFMVVKLNSSGNTIWSNYAANAKSTSAGHDCNSITTDNNGNVFLYGLASDSCQFGSIYYRAHFRENEEGIVPYSTFIAKISSTGTWQFAKELCNSSQNTLEGGVGNPDYLTCDKSNNVYALVNIRGNGVYGVIMGDTVASDQTNTYVVKLNSAGNLVYHKGFATADTYANSISFANNNLYIAGGIRNFVYNLGKPWYFSNLTVQPTSPDAGGSIEYFVSKADVNTNFQWVTSFSNPYSITQGFAAKASGDNIYTAGYYSNGISTLGNLNGTYNNFNAGVHNLFFGKLKDQYIKVGTVTPTTTCAGGSITIPFTSIGLTLSAGNTFTAELSDAAGRFTSPVAIGSTASRGSGSITATLPNTLGVGSRYIVRIKSSDTLATGYNYYAYADTGYGITIGCPAPTGFSTSNITATSANLNWIGTSCGVKYSVQIRPKGTTAWKTVTVARTTTSYTATGLTANKIYQWRVATICQSSPQIISAYGAIQQFTTASSLIADKMGTASFRSINTKELSVIVTPNPVEANAMIRVEGNNGTTILTLTDVSGRTIWQDKATAQRILLPTNNLSGGTYLLTARDNKQVTTVRVVKAN